jgi:REP element-mobilizing transposase RayT
VSCDLHCVFSTKDHAPVLTSQIRERLFRYLGGVAHKFRMHMYVAGGIEDHVHMLVNIPAVMTISEMMKLFKGSSSRWIHQTYPELEGFAWQQGYGAFSVSRSLRSKVVKYINNQTDHHRMVSFEDEFNTFLHKHELFNPNSSAEFTSTLVD